MTSRVRELEEEIHQRERIAREMENLAIIEQQERARTTARVRELEEDIRQREQREIETGRRVRELEEDIHQREQREIATNARVRELEETARRVRELEEDIRQREQREIETGRRVRELEEDIHQRERLAREQARERENLARREQQERARIAARVRELEEDIRQREQSTNARVRELEETVIQNEILANVNQVNNGNIPKQIKEIFKNDKIPVLTRYGNKSTDLLNEFKKSKESKSMITQHLEDLMIKGKISIGCSDCLLWPDVLDYVSMICEVEKLVADKVEKQVKEDYEGFSEWNNDPDTVKLTVKLTLIFNIFGLSPETIEKFGPEVNGMVFAEDIFDLCSTHGIDDLATILDLGYIQMMLRTNNLPCSKHFETCPVCCCSTPKDLENLMREHELDFDFDLLERKNINGPRFIGNSRWVKICGETIDQRKFQKAFTTVKKLHKTDDY